MRSLRRVAAVICSVLVLATAGATGEWPGGIATATTVASAPKAVWVPFTGTATVGCTRGNPSPGGVCDHHHSYVGAVDFHLEVGRPVRASGPGTVVEVHADCAVGDTGCEGGAGRWVGVAHDAGRVSRYMHLDEVLVEGGQSVSRGQLLGTSGITGNAVVPHLHYDEQQPLWTRTEMGDAFACHGTTFVRYPAAAGYATWEEVPYGTIVRNDGDGCAGTLFFDVGAASTFGDEIAWMVGAGISGGYPDGTFRPLDPVSRQAMAAFLHRVAGSPSGPFDDPGFSDVGSAHPFATEIAWMVATGRATGFADGSFRPTTCVSRQAVAAFLYREAGSPSGPFDDPGLSDVGPAHPFATEIAWMVASGIATGYRDGTFAPESCVSRQAAAAFLSRAAG